MDNNSNNNNNNNDTKFHIPRDQVVALKYGKGDAAPKILAKGSGYVAEKILDIAREKDIPIYVDEQLASTLKKLELGETIPPELFEIVAHIYAFVDRVDTVLQAQNENSQLGNSGNSGN